MSDLSNRILRLIEDKGLSYGELAEISLTPPNLKFPKSFEITGISFHFNENDTFVTVYFLTITTSI